MRLQVPWSSRQCGLLFFKNEVLFPVLPFCFPEVPSFYLLCTSLSKNVFFQLIVPSPRPAPSYTERYLPCSSFVSTLNYLMTNL